MNIETPPVVDPLEDIDSSPGFSGESSGSHLSLKKQFRSHGCEICNKTFTKKGDLKRHLFTHSGEKLHQCSICNKSFARSENLKRHWLTHSGDKPHTCNICNKSFNQHGALKNHLLRHNGEKPYTCSICNKSFPRKDYVKSHLLTHSGERPHTCSICNNSFMTKSHLRSHLLTHSEQKAHVCNICSMSFCRKDTLNRHLLAHKRKEEKELSFERGEELPSSAEKEKNANSDSHLADVSENSHVNNHPGNLKEIEQIYFTVKEEPEINDVENDDVDVGEIPLTNFVNLQEMCSDVKKENIHDDMNAIVKEERESDYEEMID